MSYADADTLAVATSARSGSRQQQLQAAASAISLILDQIGPHAALILLNASIDAVVDRLRAMQERR